MTLSAHQRYLPFQEKIPPETLVIYVLPLYPSLSASVSNTKKEKSIQASFSPDGKRRYTLEANNQVTLMGKKSTIAILKSLLKVNTPNKQVLSVNGGADYREGKSLKMDATLDVYRLLKKPASVEREHLQCFWAFIVLVNLFCSDIKPL